ACRGSRCCSTTARCCSTRGASTRWADWSAATRCRSRRWNRAGGCGRPGSTWCATYATTAAGTATERKEESRLFAGFLFLLGGALFLQRLFRLLLFLLLLVHALAHGDIPRC